MAKKPTPADETLNSGPRDVPASYHDDDWAEVIPEDGLANVTARALLDTAEQLGYDPGRAVVAFGGGFRVPRLVAETTEYPTGPGDPISRPTPTPLAALELGAVPDAPTDADS